MKRIILILILYFNLLPCIKHGEIKLIGEIEIIAQSELPGANENGVKEDKFDWDCGVGDATPTSNGCTYKEVCILTNVTKNEPVGKATYTMSYQDGKIAVLEVYAENLNDIPSSPKKNVDPPCTSSKPPVEKPVEEPPITPPIVKPIVEVPEDPPADPPLTPTIGAGGGTGTPTMVTCPSITLSSTPPTSATANDGTVTPTITGGSGSYDISISSGTPLTDGKFSGLGQGSFEVTVKDNQNSCQDVTATAELSLPCPNTKTQETVNAKSSTCSSDTMSTVYEVTRDCNGNETGRKKLSAKCKCPDDENFQVTADMLKQINPTSNSIILARMSQVANYLNQFMEDYGINTKLRLAHLLAQMSAETGGFNTLTESWHYKTKQVLFDNFKDRKKINDSNYAYYLNCICLFDMYYAGNGKDHTNGDSTTKDGSTFRGRGALQLTHRDSYYRFTQFYQNKYNDLSTDFEANPDLISTNMKFLVLSALWEFGVDKSKSGNFYNALIDADHDKVGKVTYGINGGYNLFQERKNALEVVKHILCLN